MNARGDVIARQGWFPFAGGRQVQLSRIAFARGGEVLFGLGEAGEFFSDDPIGATGLEMHVIADGFEAG